MLLRPVGVNKDMECDVEPNENGCHTEKNRFGARHGGATLAE
jgi:hypothetical protein